MQLLSAALSEEVSKAGVLTLTLPPGNAGYADAVPLSSTFKVYDGGELVYIGRPISITTDFWNCKKVVCEGPVAWLGDGIMRPFSTNSMADLVNRISGTTVYNTGYNTQAASNRQIYFPRVYDGFGSFSAESDDYTTFLDTINDIMLPAFGDGAWIRLDYGSYGNADVALTVTTAHPASGQEIRFGKNLLDLENAIDPTELYTVLIPLGKDVDTGQTDPETGAAITAPLTIRSVEPNGRDWIQNLSAAASFGRITKTVRYPEIEDPAELLAQAQQDLAAHTAAVDRLTLSAVDLKQAGADANALRVGYVSPVVSPHGVSGEYVCVKIARDLMHPEKTKVTFGAAKPLWSASAVRQQARTARDTALAAKDAAAAKGTALAAKTAAQLAQDGVDELSEEIGERTDTGSSGGGGSSGSGSGSSSDPTLWAVANRAYALAGEALDTADGAIAAIPAGATATPLMDGTAAVGSGTKWAREDHVHPTDTTRAAASDIPTAVSELTNDSGYQTEDDVVTMMALIWNEIGNGPLIYHQPTDQTAAAGDKAYFHVDALGSSLTYQWQYSSDSGTTWGNTSFTGNKTATLTVSVTAARNGYQYRCNVTGSGRTVSSGAGTLHVS